MSDRSDSRPSITDQIVDLMNAGNQLAEYVAAGAWTPDMPTPNEMIGDWQRAVLAIATGHTQRSNEATEHDDELEHWADANLTTEED